MYYFLSQLNSTLIFMIWQSIFARLEGLVCTYIDRILLIKMVIEDMLNGMGKKSLKYGLMMTN